MSDFPFRATILIPVYNVEKYLDGCINSLKEQTEPFGNMEILLINDGSRDGSADICRRWADEYENIHFYSKENEGLSKTRNFGLRHAQAHLRGVLDIRHMGCVGAGTAVIQKCPAIVAPGSAVIAQCNVG